MTAFEWFSLICLIGISWAGHSIVALWIEKSEKRIRADREYIEKANADFYEAAALYQYGAREEAMELLKPYSRDAE